MVRFVKGKKVAPWVAANPDDLPSDYTPSEDDKRWAIVDTLLDQQKPGEESFEDLKATCLMIWSFEGAISDLMNVFANEAPEDIVLKGSEAADQTAEQKARGPCVPTPAGRRRRLFQLH